MGSAIPKRDVGSEFGGVSSSRLTEELAGPLRCFCSSLSSARKHLRRDRADALQPQAETLSLTFSPMRHHSETKELFQASPGSISEAGLCASPGSALNLGHGAECASLVPGEREKMGFCLGSERR